MCDHNYQVIDSDTTTFYSDDKQFIKEVSVTFYCEKCLDIKHQDKRISKGHIKEKDNVKHSGGTIKSLGTVTHRSYC